MSDENKALVPIEEKKVDVYGDEVPAVVVRMDQAGQPVVYVPVRPICDYLGVAWSAQRLRINRDPVLSETTERVIVTITRSVVSDSTGSRLIRSRWADQATPR